MVPRVLPHDKQHTFVQKIELFRWLSQRKIPVLQPDREDEASTSGSIFVCQVDYELRRWVVVFIFCSAMTPICSHMTITLPVDQKAELCCWLSQREVSILRLGRNGEALSLCINLGLSIGL